MTAEALAALVGGTSLGSADPRRPDLGFHQGVVISWNSTTNQNMIDVAGSPIPDVPVLSTADSIMLTAGDTVALLRFKSTFFILGRVELPGVSRALGMQVEHVVGVDTITSTTFSSYDGPALPDVFVGSSRRLLVLASVGMTVGTSNSGFFGVRVSGASGIEPVDDGRLTNNSAVVMQSTVTGLHLFRASDGLNPGVHSVELEYRIASGGGGATSVFDRTIVALPF